MAEFKGKLSSEMAEFKGELGSEVAEFKGEIRSDIARFKGEIQRDMTAMEDRLREHSSKQTWKSISIMLPAVGVLVGLASYLGNVSG